MIPLFGASGTVEHVALVIKDQTEETLARERAEAARADAEGLAAQRAEQERWLQMVLDQMPMPLIFVEPGYEADKVVLKDGGRICDVAPTMLQLLGIAQPAAMTGHCLLPDHFPNAPR